jgi:two-component system phosphate regulon sensor histidine kinase PhoR
MKNKTIPLITCLFALMLLGIMLIQAWWIRTSLELNKQAFNSAVYRSLEGVVKQVEEKENYGFIKNEIKYDTLIKTTKYIIKNVGPAVRKHKTTHTVEVHTSTTNGAETIVQIDNEKKGSRTHKSMVINSSTKLPKPPVMPPPPTHLAAPPEAPEPPMVFSDNEWAVIDDKKENVEVIIEKMLKIRNPDSVSIKPAELEKIIATQLAQNNLHTAFSFALYKKKSEALYSSKYFPDSVGTYKINLYPNDLYGRNLTLALLIPAKTTHINGNMWWMFLLSLVFTLAILFLFIYSIRMLIKHKNLLEVKNDFINHMSHELKTPLATISLGADMLIGKTDKMNEAQIQKVASSIKKQSLRLHEDMKQILMNALLDNYQAKHEIFNLVKTCEQTLSEMQFLLEEKKVVVTTHFEPDEVYLKGDADLWHKVFSNLFDNAMKFSKENPEIHISITKQRDMIKIEVIDNGIGIAEKDLQNIFEKFYRLDYYKKSNIQGFGLGLSFVKKIIQLHKGSIKAESKLDAGTTFSIELPND